MTILKTIKNQYDLYPTLCSRFWTIWTYAFSAVVSRRRPALYRPLAVPDCTPQVVFGTVVTRGPRSPLAGSAVQQLDIGCELFHKAAVHSRRAAKALVRVAFCKSFEGQFLTSI